LDAEAKQTRGEAIHALPEFGARETNVVTNQRDSRGLRRGRSIDQLADCVIHPLGRWRMERVIVLCTMFQSFPSLRKFSCDGSVFDETLSHHEVGHDLTLARRE
jgi:hypothetical protein